jgi:hypothetical protein
VFSPLVCSPSPSWLVLVIEASTMLGGVDIVVVVVVAEIDVWTKVVDEPLEPKWLTKMEYASVPKDLT